MNTDIKILKTLEDQGKVLEIINTRLDALESGQDSLMAEQKSLKSGQDSIIKEQKSLRVGQDSLMAEQELLLARQKSLEEGQNVLKKEVSSIKTEHGKQLNQLTKYAKKTNKTQKEILNFLDKQDVALQKRVNRIEEHLGFSTTN